MPEAHDVVREYIAAFNARDVDGMIRLAQATVEFHTPRGVMRGHDALRGFMERQSYGTAFAVLPQAFYGRGDTIVVHASNEMRYVESGELAESFEDATAYTVTGGKVARLEMHPDLPTALAAAQLDETARLSV